MHLVEILTGLGSPVCVHCGEVLEEGDWRGPMGSGPLHWECGLRMAMGPIAHVEQRCGCYVVGSDAGDPAGVSRRQAARLVAVAIELRREQLE